MRRKTWGKTGIVGLLSLLLVLVTACTQAQTTPRTAYRPQVVATPQVTSLPSQTLLSPIQTSTPAVTPVETLAPDRYAVMAQALEPLPTFGSGGKGQIPLQRVEVQTQSVVSFDLEGQEVTLWCYLIRPYYDETLDYTIRGYLGLALFTMQNRLIWRSAWQKIDYTSAITTEITPFPFTATEIGLRYQRRVLFAGTGAHTVEYTTLYHWTGNTFTPFGQPITAASGKWAASAKKLALPLE